MKVILDHIDDGNEEVIIKYKNLNDRIEGIVRYIEQQGDKLLGMKDDQQCIIKLPDVIYLESVDGITYLYTDTDVYRTNLTLTTFEMTYSEEGFFRCSKSMVIHIYRIQRLKSISGNRIDVTMDNGEHVIISRKYTKELRRIIKGE